VALLAGLAALSVSAPASAAPGDTDKVVKVFVVKDPSQTGGRPATLKTIATSTLGDSGRAAEIFDLNRGRAQPDGGALLDEGDALHPGWILRLPQDAAGPDVQLAKDNGGQSATGGGSSASPPADKAGTDGGTTTITTRTTALDVPLPAALAVAGAVLLALMTAAIVARQQVGRAFAPVGRAVRKLGDGRRRRRRLQERRLTGRRFAADAGSVRRAYGELALAAGTTDKPVHALRVGPDGATVWLAAPATMSAPWTRGDSTRWHRPADADGWLNRGAEGGGSESPSLDTEACLVRVGTDPDGEPVFVDLSRLDGVLSVTGDRDVVRDVAQNLLAEIARGRPGSRVTVLRGAEPCRGPCRPA
jgi:hypothetical protein